MNDDRQFFTFVPTQPVVKYIDFYINQESSSYDCFSSEAGRDIMQHARQLMMEDPSPETVSQICHLLDEELQQSEEAKDQFSNFKRYFLPYFSNLMEGEFFDDIEEETVFLARGDDTITYDQLRAAWKDIRDPTVKYAAEMGIDMWQDLYSGEKNDHFIGDTVYDFISYGEHADTYRNIIFDAAAASDDYIIPALVNIFIHAYNDVCGYNASADPTIDDFDEDNDYIME